MNVALIAAGGIGARTGQTTPKQFIEICGMPVIAHTMHAFQTHPEIDAICVVCLDGWHDKLIEIAKKYGITKLKHITSGGTSNQESIFNGLVEIHANYPDDTTIIIHDAVRPMISHEVISDCINTTHKHGNAFAALKCPESMMFTDNGKTSVQDINRESLRRIQTPNGCKLGDIWAAHTRANAMALPPFAATCNLMVAMGYTIHFSIGSECNHKITNTEDFNLIRALITIKQCTK